MGKANTLIRILLIVSLVFASNVSFAKHKRRPAPVDFTSILKALAQTYGVNLEQLETQKDQTSQLQRSYDMYEKQLKKLEENNKAITGKTGYGLKDFQTYNNTWLDDRSNMNNLLDAYSAGNGLVGGIAKNREREFPIDLDVINKSKLNKQDIDYYKLSAKTALSTRAASEAEFNRIEQKIRDQEKLQKEINNTENLKSSVDLLARIQAENNKISLESLRMLSVLTQQSAISEQAQVNARVQNAKFLSN